MVRALGYSVVRYNASVLYHKIGATKTRFGKTFGEHSPVREYYIARNTLYFNKKYGRRGVPLLWIIRRIKRVLIYETQKLAKVKMIWQGFLDYQNKIGGKYDGNH